MQLSFFSASWISRLALGKCSVIATNVAVFQSLIFLDGHHHYDWPCLATNTGSARARSIKRPKPYLASFADMHCMACPCRDQGAVLAILAHFIKVVSDGYYKPASDRAVGHSRAPPVPAPRRAAGAGLHRQAASECAVVSRNRRADCGGPKRCRRARIDLAGRDRREARAMKSERPAPRRAAEQIERQLICGHLKNGDAESCRSWARISDCTIADPTALGISQAILAIDLPVF